MLRLGRDSGSAGPGRQQHGKHSTDVATHPTRAANALCAPLALPLMAWSEGRERDKWIGRGGEALDRALLEQAISRVRDRGWSLVLRSDAQVRFEGAVARLPLTGATGDLASDVTEAARALSLEGYEPAEIEPAATYDVRIITAPVFGEDSQPALLLSLYQLPANCPGRRSNSIGID